MLDVWHDDEGVILRKAEGGGSIVFTVEDRICHMCDGCDWEKK